MVTVPTLSALPTIVGSDPADMPASLGKLRTPTDDNFLAIAFWMGQVREASQQVVDTNPWTSIATGWQTSPPPAGHGHAGAWTRGRFCYLNAAVSRATTAIGPSGDFGQITAVTMGTLKPEFRPQYTVYPIGRMWQRTIFCAFTVEPIGYCVLRGFSAPNVSLAIADTVELYGTWIIS